jgi:hypothetical protein
VASWPSTSTEVLSATNRVAPSAMTTCAPPGWKA